MRKIKGALSPKLSEWVGSEDVAVAEAAPVSSFRELVQVVAHLSYLNKDYLLFFRGQPRDYRNKAGTSTIYPAIYRGERLPKEQVERNFDVLLSAAERLCDALQEQQIESHRDVRHRRYIQWSILQHYEVCPTPLLDLTQSLRVACSFAFLQAEGGDPCVFAFGLPYLTNRISINSEHDLVNIRLLSICPPEALRPHFQEGYLAGTDEITTQYDSKNDLDFNIRLIAKFRLNGGKSFWQGGFRAFPPKALYPPEDRFMDICEGIREDLDSVPAWRIGNFMKEWFKLEARLVTAARGYETKRKVYSIKEAMDILRRKELTSPEIIEKIQDLRQLRNKVVHRPDRANPKDVIRGTGEIQAINKKIGAFDLSFSTAFTGGRL